MYGRRTKILNNLRSLFKNSPSETFLRFLTSGIEFGHWTTKLVPNHYQYAQNSIRKAKFNGVNYLLDISDIVDWFVYYGFHERSRSTLLHLGKGAKCIIDVGANMGAVSLSFASTYPEAEIWAFEPDPHNYSRLKTNIALNPQLKINACPIGLGESHSKVQIATIDLNNRGKNKIVDIASDDITSAEVEIVTLDAFWKEGSKPPIDLIKIDVEGYEYRVLKGAISVIEAFRPALFIEIDDNNLREQGSSAIQTIQLLENLGYRISKADCDTFVDSSDDFKNCHFDIVAVMN